MVLLHGQLNWGLLRATAIKHTPITNMAKAIILDFRLFIQSILSICTIQKFLFVYPQSLNDTAISLGFIDENGNQITYHYHNSQ